MKSSLAAVRLTTLLLIITGISAAPLQAISGRENIDESLRMYAPITAASSGFTFLSRAFNATVGILLILIAIEIFRKRIFLTRNVQSIIGGLAAYFVSNYIVGALLGSHSGLPGIYLCLSILALILLGFAKEISPSMLIDIFRYIAAFMVLGSLASGIFIPDWSYMEEVSYNFGGDGAAKRLVGFFDHPSTLGIYALMLIAVELRISKNSFLHMGILILSPIVLLMSLSKTAIALAIIMYVWHLAKKGIWGLITIAAFSYMLIIGILNFPSILLTFTTNENFSTLTGRTGLWKIIVNSWLKNPLFGNGPALFPISEPENFAHAHNIILQAMSDGGLLGLLGLLLYLLALLRTAYANGENTRHLPLLLVSLLFLFSLSEPVIRINSFVNGLFFINAFVVLYLCALDRRRNHTNNFPIKEHRYSQGPVMRFSQILAKSHTHKHFIE